MSPLTADRRVVRFMWAQRARRVGFSAALGLAALVALGLPAAAQSCTKDDFARAVDGAGVALRKYNTEAAPTLQGRLRDLRQRKGWSDADYENRVSSLLTDQRTIALDEQANELYAKIDALGVTPIGAPDCDKLVELQAASIELLATMKAKSAHMLARIDAEIADGTTATPGLKGSLDAGAPPAAPPAAPSATKAPVAPERTKEAKAALPSRPAIAPPLPARPASPPQQRTTGWATTTEQTALSAELPPPVPQLPLAAPAPVDESYSIDEVREITRGFFGQVSAGLASVIEYAFQHSGRPTAYVLGTEGGGAFLAGLRYGEGTLYMRRGNSERIYWHGPSLGYDFGASGSRTMFLIYRTREPGQLYRRFSGIDGSAYLVGGVGITFLTNGDVVMAPIRSGLGLRLGANIGYVRFTPQPTWNPF